MIARRQLTLSHTQKAAKHSSTVSRPSQPAIWRDLWGETALKACHPGQMGREGFMFMLVYRLGPTIHPSHFPEIKLALVPPIKDGRKCLRCVTRLPEGQKKSDERAIIFIVKEGSIELPHSRTITNSSLTSK